ncbi:MAG: metallophosphoesterase [Pararhizobium sp.]
MRSGSRISRRMFLGGVSAAFASAIRPAAAPAASSGVTFVFTSDVHACLMQGELSPKCQVEGKTDENLRRHIHAINRIHHHEWPRAIGAPIPSPIERPRGVVIAGDLTDDGGGQVVVPGEGTQLQQFSHRYQAGRGPDQIHFPVYVGLGNHDLDQDGPKAHRDWYRREMRDYVEINYRPSVFYKPPLPATDYDPYSDNYAWDWDNLHLVQAQRFAGDTRKGAVDSLPWLRQDLEAYAADGRPVILFQHYGWDAFSVGRWDPARHRFDPQGLGPSRWWTDGERAELLEAIADFNVIGIFHGHQHDRELIYRVGGLDVFSAKAAYLGGFAVVRVTADRMDVAFAEAGADGSVTFGKTFSKAIAAHRRT